MLSESNDAAMPIHGRGELEAAFSGQDFGASVVGAGTFGKVCLAIDRSGVKVALKFCREWCGRSAPGDQLVVMQEARRVFSARGPHVVKLLGVFRRLNAPPVLMFIAADKRVVRFSVNPGCAIRPHPPELVKPARLWTAPPSRPCHRAPGPETGKLVAQIRRHSPDVEVEDR